MVKGAVSLIEGLEPTAGEIIAIIAEPHNPFSKQVALLFHKGTILAAWQTAVAVRLPKPLLLQVIFHR